MNTHERGIVSQKREGFVMNQLFRETWIEVNLDAIKKNIQAIRRHIPKQTKIMAVVKANAYGHGSVGVARHALEYGATSSLSPFWKKASSCERREL